MAETDQSPSVADYLQTWFDSYGNVTRRSYRDFVSAFTKFTNNRHLTFDDIDEDFSLSFRSYLVAKQNSASYTNRIGQNFKSFYRSAVKKGFARENNQIFSWISSTKPAASNAKSKKNSPNISTILKRLNSIDIPHDSSVKQSLNLLQLSISMGGIDFKTLYSLKGECIIDEYIYLEDSERKYKINPFLQYHIDALRGNENWLLQCWQSTLSIAKAEKKWLSYLEYLFSVSKIDSFTVNSELPSQICSQLLNELKVSITDSKLFLYKTPTGSSLNLIETPKYSQQVIDNISERIADNIRDMRLHWYAMIFKGDQKNVENKLSESGNEGYIRCFYPLENKRNAKDGKIVKTSSPFIKNIMFVECTQETLGNILRKKDLQSVAYFLRDKAKKNKDFAVIPSAQMNTFITFVTNGLDILDENALNNINIESGSYVHITDGPLKGYRGHVMKIHKNKNGNSDISVLEIEANEFGNELASIYKLDKKWYLTVSSQLVKSVEKING
jgi:transcription antitermination factor NusG